jgi:hypothetical protein
MFAEKTLASKEASYSTVLLKFRGERQQRDVARPLNGFAEPPLVARASARHAPRENLATLLNEWLKHLDPFVIDEVHALDAETANLLLSKILALAAATRAAWPPAGTTGTAAFAGSASPATSTEAFTATPTSASGVSFGAVSAASGMPLGARRAGSGRCGWSAGCGAGSFWWC